MDDLFAPDFEGHYQKLLATLRAQARAKPSCFWLAILMDKLAEDLDETKRQRAYIEDVSILPCALLYFDLPGIDPLLARVFVLARLVVDNAPIAFLGEQLKTAIADAIAKPTPTTAPVMLFTDRMQVEPIASDDAASIAPPFDSRKWDQALAKQLWGNA